MYGLIQEAEWMEWLATHHKWSLVNTVSLITVQWPEQHLFIIYSQNCFLIHSLRKKNIQKFPGGLVTDPLARAC